MERFFKKSINHNDQPRAEVDLTSVDHCGYKINDKVKLLLNNNYYDFTKHYGYIKSIEYRNNRYLYDVLVIGYYDYLKCQKRTPVKFHNKKISTEING
jgi:hypothetical protein